MPEVLPPLPERFHLSAEFRLLVACSWRPPAPWDCEQSKLIATLCADSIDWTAFQNLIDRHRVPVLVHANLAKYGGGNIPEEHWMSIQTRARKATALSLLQAAELTRLTRIFREAGIDLLPLKGTTLSLRLYGEPAVRSLRDLDLLVRTGDFDRAERLLLAQGYRRTSPDSEATPRMKSATRSRLQHHSYVHANRNILVELHWRVHDWNQKQLEELWNRSRDLQWNGTKLRHIEDGFLFLLLCEHGSEHEWFRLKWLSDVAMLATREDPPSPAALEALVQDLDLEISVGQTLVLIRWLYRIAPPEWMCAFAPADARSVSLASMALEVILSPREDIHRDPLRMLLHRSRYLQIQGRRSSVTRHLRNIALRPYDAGIVPLPDCLFWLYYVLRPFLWTWRRLFGR